MSLCWGQMAGDGATAQGLPAKWASGQNGAPAPRRATTGSKRGRGRYMHARFSRCTLSGQKVTLLKFWLIREVEFVSSGRHCYSYGDKDISCPDLLSDERNCNEEPCPVDGQWGYWSDWSTCTQPCAGGIKQRLRNCEDPRPLFGGE